MFTSIRSSVFFYYIVVAVLTLLDAYFLMDVAGALCIPYVKVGGKQEKPSTQAIKRFIIGLAYVLVLALLLLSKDVKLTLDKDFLCVSVVIFICKCVVWIVGFVIVGFKYPLIDVFRKKFVLSLKDSES